MASRGDNIIDIGTALDAPADAPLMADPGDVGPFGGRDEDDELDRAPLPPGCPVTPLGILEQKCWYLDVRGQIIGLEAGQRHGVNSLVALFGPKSGWLEKTWPRWSAPKTKLDRKTGVEEVIKPSEIVGFDQGQASRGLIEECVRKGIFDPAGKIRGAGAHRGSNDALIIHCGDTVMRRRLRINGEADDIEYFDPGLHGEHVYPTAPAIPRPWPEPVGVEVGERLRAVIASWRWRRPLLDPLLIVGGIGASMTGGALDWRPNIWVTGGAGTGKSTLNGKRGLLDQLTGKGKLASVDTSAAGIRQRLRNSTVPVFLDELEADADGRKTKQIIELARVASSGGDAHRGGQDHQATEFTLQSVFWASSILIPSMETQDRSRWAVCALDPLRAGDTPPNMRALRLPEMGRQILRRMVDGWARWDETLAAYRSALADLGHKARACDQFGTLLACADLVLYDALPDDRTIAEIAGLCDMRSLREVSESAADHEDCLQHLVTTMVQARGGDERESIGSWIGSAVQEMCAPQIAAEHKHHRRLQEIGIKIVSVKVNAAGDDGRPVRVGTEIWTPGKPGFVAIANTHQAIAGVYHGQKWQNGVWAQSLSRFPGAVEGVTLKFGRLALRGTLVPLDQVIDPSEIPLSARWATIGSGVAE